MIIPSRLNVKKAKFCLSNTTTMIQCSPEFQPSIDDSHSNNTTVRSSSKHSTFVIILFSLVIVVSTWSSCWIFDSKSRSVSSSWWKEVFWRKIVKKNSVFVVAYEYYQYNIKNNMELSEDSLFDKHWTCSSLISSQLDSRGQKGGGGPRSCSRECRGLSTSSSGSWQISRRTISPLKLFFFKDKVS